MFNQAAETVNPRVPSTLEAAACLQNGRGQITGVLDGPLALDNARVPEPKSSPRRGQGECAHCSRSGSRNMLARACPSAGQRAGVVLGARVPIALTSRADVLLTRLASCAVIVLIAAAQRAKTSLH